MITKLTRILLPLLVVSGLTAQFKMVPPKGVAVSDADRAELKAGLAKLAATMEPLKDNPLLPDVMIFHKAVRFALEGEEFFKPEETIKAKALLKAGQERAEALAGGSAPWASTTGLVVRGYVSKIDQSVQPYGLVIPPTFGLEKPHRWRLDTWFHGRNETLSEVNFLADRMKNPGEFTPRDTIVLHLYGRYCNANKFAGEVDLFEALDAVKRQYNIDEKRISVRGFSMGGAATWHFAAQHAGLWAAAAPGAGFAETREFQGNKLQPTWWEEKLLHLTDATDYALNFYQLPLVAYNGEIDKQAQAADIMERYLGEEGMRLSRVIGPNTGHKYHPDSKPVISRIVDAAADRGNDLYPKKIKFTTWTLAYNRMKWVTVDSLEKHWNRARVDAEITGDHTLTATTRNVSGLTFQMSAGGCPLDETVKPTVTLDGQKLTVAGPMTDRSWVAHFHKVAGKWAAGEETGLRKSHGLQGPIDDAFLDSFVMVRPTGKPMIPAIAPWVASEEARAEKYWRTQFRGEAQVRDDSAVTDADIANSNLILWGDPGSNQVLARIADRLPIKWNGSNAVIMIYPNPLNPKKYVVLNSGVTFREASNQSNALQVAKLPDYAIVDTTTPPDGNWPGKIVDAGFFGEKWELMPNGGH